MPFGLRNAVQTFQRFMDAVLRGLIFCYGYTDDILVTSSSPEEYLQHLQLVLECLDDHGILINVEKSPFEVPSLDFLGHRCHGRSAIGEQSARYPQLPPADIPEEAEGSCWPRQLLSMFHPPLRNPPPTPESALGQHQVQHSHLERGCYIHCQGSPCKHPEHSAPTCIMTDASETAVGAVLQQLIAGQWQPLLYFSKALKPAQTHYSAFDRELLVIYLSIKHFQ